MITKAIIKSKPAIGGTKYTVYIPLLRTATDEEVDATLSATLCYTPGISNAFSVGDVVFVSFEDNLYDKPVILGKLYTGQETSSPTQILARTIKVTDKFSLENHSSVFGDSSVEEITTADNAESIRGLYESVSSQGDSIGSISSSLDDVSASLEELKGKVLGGAELIAEGALTSIDAEELDDYALVFVYGYKENITPPNQTCFCFMPSQLQDVGQNTPLFQTVQNAEWKASAWEYRLIIEKLDGVISWYSDFDYGGSTAFIATQIVGVRFKDEG